MKTTQKSLAWLAAVLALLATGMAFTVWSYRQIEEASNLRRDSRTIITAGDRLLSALTEAETAQRGYALTGDESYLQPYLDVRDGMQLHVETLRRMASNPSAQQHVEALAPLVRVKMQEMEKTIALRRSRDVMAALALINSDEGKRLMEGIRREMGSFVQIETDIQAQHNAQFDAGLRRLFASIVGVGVLAVLFALYFAYASYRAAQQRLKDLVHLETRHLLEAQTATNAHLQQTNRTLQASEQKLTVTLNSIGDAVIATDAAACVTLLNPVAEGLTGWSSAQAQGRPIDEVFHILAKATRARATIPVASVLANGTVQGMANHTVLVARDGSEFDIADSCAPIRDAGGLVIGAVLVFRNVTDEYHAQQALRDSAARVQAILNTVGDGVVTLAAETGVMESVNPAVERMFGYEADELKGKGFGFVVPELDQNHGSVSLAHYEPGAQARAMGQGREVMGFRKDGSFFPLEITVSEMLLGGERYFTGILRDISARKQVEAALVKANALQNAIFNSANFSSIATDTQGVIQIFNVGAEHMLGYTAAEVMNTVTPADLSDPTELVARAQALTQELQTEITPGFEALVFKASRGIEDIYELTYIRKDGTRLPAMVSVTALRDAAGTIIGYLLIGTDNSVRKQLDAERSLLDKTLQIKNIELEAARLVADKANLAKSEFLSNMSHELRSPLNAILGFAQLMESSVPAPSAIQKSSIDQILKAGWYLLELINEILDLALIESGRLSMSIEPVSLPEVLLDCRTMIEPLASRRGIEMHFPSFSGPCFVEADRTRAKQVFVNLLSNAIKYNRLNGAVEVTCQTQGADRMHITVRDTGEGLSESKLAQLFQPFNRLGQEDSDEEGTGIGLVVSKRLVELMGGSIGANSTEGVGSEFWIELQLADPHTLTLDALAQPVLLPAPVQDGQKVRTLLYVEDNLANMELVAQLIARRPDMRLLRAEDGARGVALARASLPDVILMDINLPGISGLQALGLLQDDPLTRHIPVLALSANAMPRDVEKGLEAGFFRYLTKPIKIGEFMKALDQGLRLAGTASDETTLNEIDT
ncbi:MAG: PAS domain S-box protein [Rhodoferax sp.]